MIRVLQFKFIDRKAMKVFQGESKQLSEQHKKALERNDKTGAEAIMKKQMELFPKMNKIMMGQLKLMVVIIGIFFVFTTIVGYIDPTIQDDITLELKDDGLECDEQAEDNIFSTCFDLQGKDRGVWTARAKVYNSNNIIAENSTAFIHSEGDIEGIYLEPGTGEALTLSTDRPIYNIGEKVSIFASVQNANRVEITMDSGTRFFVDLPFTIPILNVQRIHQPYWWFIFVSIIVGLLISIGFNIYQKIRKEENT